MKNLFTTFHYVAGILCAVAVTSIAACGETRMSPSSPTPLSVSAGGLRSPGDALFDYHEDPYPPPDPAPVPPSDPAPAPGPAPTALTISIVGSFGSNAFTPNPIQASVGAMIVWTNSDGTKHRIVLDDGTVIGDVLPGQSSVPMPLMSPTATYRCTIHPTMVGSINGEAAPEPPTSPDPPPPGDYYIR